MEIATIGFTHSSAEHFFERLKTARVEHVLDVRLHNSSQLAGFAKGNDLEYFARSICGASYSHDVRLSPTEEMFSAYRKQGRGWAWLEKEFLLLMTARDVPGILDRGAFQHRKTVLVCSESTPETCHRRLVAELLEHAWSARIEHL